MKDLCTYTTTVVVFLFAVNTVFADGIKPTMTKHVVSRGEYIMGIAESIHGSSDVCKTDDFIKYVVAYNYLDANATIHPGQTIFIPTLDSWRKYVYSISVRGTSVNQVNELTILLKENEKLKEEKAFLLSQKDKQNKNINTISEQKETIAFVPDNSVYTVFIGIGLVLFICCTLCLFVIRKNKKTIYELQSLVREKEDETIEIVKNTGDIVDRNKKLHIINKRVAHIVDALFQEKSLTIHELERFTRWFEPIIENLSKINANKTPTGEKLANIIDYILDGQPNKNKKDIIWSLVGRLIEMEENENLVVKEGWENGHDRMHPIPNGIMSIVFHDHLFFPEKEVQTA